MYSEKILDLKEKIEIYYREKDKKSLLDYVKEELARIYKGMYVETDSLCIYPLLKKLEKALDDECEQIDVAESNRKEIESVFRIITGDEDIKVVVEVGLNRAILNYAVNKDIWKKWLYGYTYSMFEKFIDNNEKYLIDMVFQSKDSGNLQNTIFELLEGKISDLVGYYHQEECELCKLYPVTKEQQFKSKIIRYMECYLGKREVDIFIEFNKGNYKISI